MNKPEKKENIRVMHGKIDHAFGAYCEECMEVARDWPYTKQLLEKVKADTRQSTISKIKKWMKGKTVTKEKIKGGIK